MMRTRRRQAILLVLLLAAIALLAQIGGVGTKRPAKAAKAQGTILATVAGGTVPDITSTSLARADARAAEGETVRMSATATVIATKLPAKSAAQVICGVRLTRAGDPSWTLGTPYETGTITKVNASQSVTIERSFTAPASDSYRMVTACHVAAPATGAEVRATGTMRAALGLPAGAATPVE